MNEYKLKLQISVFNDDDDDFNDETKVYTREIKLIYDFDCTVVPACAIKILKQIKRERKSGDYKLNRKRQSWKLLIML